MRGHPHGLTGGEILWGSHQYDQGQLVKHYLQPIRHHSCQPGISGADLLNEVNMLDSELSTWLCPRTLVS